MKENVTDAKTSPAALTPSSSLKKSPDEPLYPSRAATDKLSVKDTFPDIVGKKCNPDPDSSFAIVVISSLAPERVYPNSNPKSKPIQEENMKL